MPSPKNPIQIVAPGSGRLPAATISASAFIVPNGGGGGGVMAALQAHITDPVDAHMAGAIGIPPVNPLTGEPLLSSNMPPGVIDGESVLDFIAQFKDLLPPRPKYLGVSGAPNSGAPYWGNLNLGQTGGYKDVPTGTTFYTHYVTDHTVSTFDLSGILYPSDRGVLALYSKTDGDFTNPFQTATLQAALYLGTTVPAPPNPLPAGLPAAGFDETLRSSNQPDYTPSMAGVDRIEVTYRYPYLKAYPPGVPYSGYSTDFYSFQLATYKVTQAVAAGGNQNWFIVHWRSSFATSKNAIDPSVSALNLASLTAANCYSAVPSSAADFDRVNNPVFTLNRHNVFKDTNSAGAPALFAISSALTANTHWVSGVEFYDKTGVVSWTYSVTFTGLFDTAFQTGTSAPVPSDVYSVTDPIALDFSEFGAVGFTSFNYTQVDDGAGTYFSVVNPPLTTDKGRRTWIHAINPATLIPFTAFPASNFLAEGRTLWTTLPVADAAQRYLWNSWDATGLAGAQANPPYDMETVEKFVDESYRYDTAFVPVSTATIRPSGPAVAYDSTALLLVGTTSLQVIGSKLVYPTMDFSNGYLPVGQDYSNNIAGDGADFPRRYMRAFNTGVARNIGRLRIRGIAAAAFQVNAGYNGNETTGHLTGGAILQVMVPGVTDWMDLGRPYGDPAPSIGAFYGCGTGVVVSGADLIVSYQTGSSFTSENVLGSGKFPLFVRVTFLNNAAGRALLLDEIEWLAP